jgi:hypothetical protein
MLNDMRREIMALIGGLFHRWRLEHHQSSRHKVNVTTPAGRQEDHRALPFDAFNTFQKMAGGAYAMRRASQLTF